MESNILLESGTNELEVLEFMVGEQSFGINIAKFQHNGGCSSRILPLRAFSLPETRLSL